MDSQPADLHRELLPQKSEDWGYTSVAEPLPRRRKWCLCSATNTEKVKQNPCSNMLTSEHQETCVMSAQEQIWGLTWNSFENCQVTWVPTLELFGASQPWSASWTSTRADDVLEGCSDTEAGEWLLHQSSDPQTRFGRSYFGTWSTSNHSLSILSVVHTANWPHLGRSFDETDCQMGKGDSVSSLGLVCISVYFSRHL